MQNTNESYQLPPQLKKILWSILAVALVAVGCFVWWYVAKYRNYTVYREMVQAPRELAEGTEFKKLTSGESLPGFELAAENETMALYLKRETAEIAVRDKRDGTVVYSNPQDAGSDPIAKSGSNQENLRSQFILSYLNAADQEGVAWSSNAKAVKNEQVEFQSIPDGLRVIYTLSNKKMLLVPDQLNEAWYSQFDGVKDVTSNYVLNEENGLYELKTRGLTTRTTQKIDAALRKGGFSLDDYEEMQALQEKDEETEEEEALSFVVTLDWRLNADGVQVTVPYEGIEEYGGGKIRSIQLAPFFGAAGSEETGAMVVPDGSGALIRFNNGKNSFSQYTQSIYEMDLVDSDLVATQNIQPARLPLFGICRENETILATCERGASLANVVADVAGRYNNYNYAYFTFNVRRTDTLLIAGEEAPVAERDYYPVDCTVRYTLLGKDYTGYSGLARAYRERLLSEGKLRQAGGESGDIPFYYDVIGGVKETAHWFGVQYLRVLSMTSFDQAQSIAAELKREGISNQCMNLQGWMNGGYYHDPVTKVRVLGQLGGEGKLRDLQEFLLRSGGMLYPDASVQFVTDIAKGFRVSEEASRYYAEGYAVELGVINPVTLRRTATLGYRVRGYLLLSPKFLPRHIAGLRDAVNRLKLKGVSLRDLGSELHSDKRRNNLINREAALDVVRNAFGQIASTDASVMVAGGNDYSLPYASHVINAPVMATIFPIVDEEIPLWEMVVHGSMGYAGSAMNLTQSENQKVDLLHLIEIGASTHYTFTWRDAADMKYTGVNNNFATTFSTWKDKAVEAYRFVNGALHGVSGAAMVEHTRLENGFARVRYDNGVTIYVNSSESEASADGVSVPALSYLVVGGEQQ